MNGHGSHTFMWVNANGEKFWGKYHFKTNEGIENFTDAEAKAMVTEGPDYHMRNLYEAIENGNGPFWALEMQIMLLVQPVRPEQGLAPRQLSAQHERVPFDSDCLRLKTLLAVGSHI